MKMSKKIVGAVVGALTGGIGGYFLGARQMKKELALEPVEVLESEVMDADAALEAAAEAVTETATQA